MVDKTCVFCVFLSVIFLFFISSVSANFVLGNQSYSIGNIYGPSGSITGWVNISFNSEPLNANFTSSTGNSISLGNLLNQNMEYIDTCSTYNCRTDYSASNAQQTKTATLNAGDSSIYGIKLTGNIASINSINFQLTSDAGPSCLNQVEVDFLGDGSIDNINTNSAGSNSCSDTTKSYGCFNQSLVTDNPQIVTTPLCELVNLSVSPGFFIGAWIQKISGSEVVNASLYTVNGINVVKHAECTLPDASSNGGEVSCIVNYSVSTPQQAYVCIRNVSGNGNYVTQAYSSPNGCGFSGTPVSTASAAYPIFAEGQQFDSVGTMNLNLSYNQSINQAINFSNLAENYIIQNYNNGLNCTAGCIIPIKINSNVPSQSITLSNLLVNYKTDIGQLSTKNFYDLSAAPAKVSSDFQPLYLDNAGFTLPSNIGNYAFSLNLDGQSLISQQVQIANIPVIRLVNPLRTAYAYPTTFSVSVDSSQNLSIFSWDFGDNSSIVTTDTNSTTHTYNSAGVYNLMINVTDENNLSSSKTFAINVSSPTGLIAANLNDMKRAVSVLQGQVAAFTSFQQQALNASLNLGYINSQLNLLTSEFSNASTPSDYNNIVAGLLAIKIPDQIYDTATAQNVPFVQQSNNVNMNVLQEIAGGNYTQGQDQAYADAINTWQQLNLNMNMNYDEFTGSYSGYLDPVAKVFTITVSEKKDVPYDYYLVLPQMGGFTSDSNYSTKDNYIYFDLKNKNTVSFSTTDNIDVTNLPAFISPAISQLDVTTTTAETPILSKWVTFSLIVVGILIVAIVVYLLLRRWYDRRYENYLFKNRNDLYNMVNYVNNAKGKGMQNNEIEQNLRKAGWSGERVVYVMRKYAGKRTGLL
ncbi:MAG: PKD domain-containing protein [Candidatus Pacearchaeota archaeon]|jgi:hypothetical protein